MLDPQPPAGLVIGDLAPHEVLADLAWQGTPTHLKAVVEAVERAQRGEVDYLVARLGDLVVGSGGVDFVPDPAAGELWQLAVRPGWQSRGIGTAMIRALEERITARGRAAGTLKVEVDNPRARALYSRLGYRVVEASIESWEIEDADGSTRTYSTDCLVLRHDLDLSRTRGGELDEPLTPAGSPTMPPVGVCRTA